MSGFRPPYVSGTFVPRKFQVLPQTESWRLSRIHQKDYKRFAGKASTGFARGRTAAGLDSWRALFCQPPTRSLQVRFGLLRLRLRSFREQAEFLQAIRQELEDRFGVIRKLKQIHVAGADGPIAN